MLGGKNIKNKISHFLPQSRIMYSENEEATYALYEVWP